jgi:hypothetical protein
MKNNTLVILALLGIGYFIFIRKKPNQPITSVNGLNDGGVNGNGDIVALDPIQTEVTEIVEVEEQPDTFTNLTGNGSVTAPNGVPEISTGTPFPPQVDTLNVNSFPSGSYSCTSPSFAVNLSACYDEAGNINGNYSFGTSNWWSSKQPYGNTSVKFGQESCNVAELQRLLNQIQPENPVAVDGSYGCNTLKKLCTLKKCSQNEANVNGQYASTSAGKVILQRLYDHYISQEQLSPFGFY